MQFISDIISHLFEWIQSAGYFGIMIGLMIEVIPSEIVLAFGGYLVSQGDINFLVPCCSVPSGSSRPDLRLLDWPLWRQACAGEVRQVHFYLQKHIDHSEEWFQKYGTGVIFTARFIPVVRHAISVPAGISRMPLGKFTLLTTLAVIPWSALFVYLGYTLGDKWKTIDEVAAKYTHEILLGAIAVIILYFLFKWYKSKKKGSAV